MTMPVCGAMVIGSVLELDDGEKLCRAGANREKVHLRLARCAVVIRYVGASRRSRTAMRWRIQRRWLSSDQCPTGYSGMAYGGIRELEGAQLYRMASQLKIQVHHYAESQFSVRRDTERAPNTDWRRFDIA